MRTVGWLSVSLQLADDKLIISITQITVCNTVDIGFQKVPFFVHAFQTIDKLVFLVQRIRKVG